jgi:hypothetical protein
MPIVGLSDRDEAFPEIAKIHKGAKKRKNAQGKEIFGEELTYFRVEWSEGEAKAEAEFRRLYGDTPNAIRVLFPFNEITRFWDPWKVAFVAGGKLAQSDGKFVNYLQTVNGDILVRDYFDKDGNKVPHPADNIAGVDFEGKPVPYKDSGLLRVLLYDLPRAAYMTVITGSKHDIANISSQLRAFKELNHQQIAGVPFILRRVPKMVSTPNGKGKPRVRRKKYLISIEVDPDWMKLKFGELRALAMPESIDGDVVAELPPGEVLPTELDEDELDGEEIEGESAEAEAEEAPREMVSPLSERAVKYAAGHWNVSDEQAAKDIAKKNLGKLVVWNDFVDIVRG